MKLIENKPERPNGGHGPFYMFFVEDKALHLHERRAKSSLERTAL